MDDLLVVLPTLNERQNVGPMAERIASVLPGVSYHIIYVDDDSTDGTRDELARLAEADTHVGYIHRIGRSGLSSAVIEGALAWPSRYVVVMDADLQHDEKLLPKMLEMLKTEPLDIVIASRFAPGASLGDFAESRVKTSQRGIMLAQKILSIHVDDPLTGYFMMRRGFFEEVAPKLQPKGFKILLDVLHKAGPSVRFREIPFVFGTRLAGESKLDTSVGFDYLAQLYEAKFDNLLPLNILLALCLLVGLFVVAWLTTVLTSTIQPAAISDLIALIPATGIAFWLKLNGLRKRQRPKGADRVRTAVGFSVLVLIVSLPLLVIGLATDARAGWSDAVWIAFAVSVASFAYPLKPKRAARTSSAASKRTTDIESREASAQATL